MKKDGGADDERMKSYDENMMMNIMGMTNANLHSSVRSLPQPYSSGFPVYEWFRM